MRKIIVGAHSMDSRHADDQRADRGSEQGLQFGRCGDTLFREGEVRDRRPRPRLTERGVTGGVAHRERMKREG